MQYVENKVIIITGASSGIGAETAKVLAKNGAKVVLSARREDRLKKLAEEIGPNTALYAVSQPGSVDVSDLVVRSGKEA